MKNAPLAPVPSLIQRPCYPDERPGDAHALSLTGGRRAVRLRQGDDSLAPLFRAFLGAPAGDAPGDGLIVVEAGDFRPHQLSCDQLVQYRCVTET